MTIFTGRKKLNAATSYESGVLPTLNFHKIEIARPKSQSLSIQFRVIGYDHKNMTTRSGKLHEKNCSLKITTDIRSH